MYNIFRILIEVPDYNSSFCFFFKNVEEAIPPGGKKYLGTTKASTRMILVHVQKMYNILRKFIGVPDYSSSSFFFFSKNEEEAIPPPLRPSSKLGVLDYSRSESLRAQGGEDGVGRRRSGPTVYRATSGRLA